MTLTTQNLLGSALIPNMKQLNLQDPSNTDNPNIIAPIWKVCSLSLQRAEWQIKTESFMLKHESQETIIKCVQKCNRFLSFQFHSE